MKSDEHQRDEVRRVRSLWREWKRVAKWIGDTQARILLTLFYFVVFGPFALAIHWGSDPLAMKPGSVRGWRPKGEADGTPMERARRQF